MNTDNIKAIIFDVDETLTPPKVTGWVQSTLPTEVHINNIVAILHKYLAMTIPLEDAINEASSLWRSGKDCSKEAMISFSSQVKFREDAIKVVNALKAKGYLIAFISNSPDIFLKTISKQFNLDQLCYSTEFIFDKNNNFQTFTYPSDPNKSKYILFKQFLKKYNLEAANCVAVGNGFNDLEIFKAVEISFAMNDSGVDELKAIATKTIDNLSDLLQFL